MNELKIFHVSYIEVEGIGAVSPQWGHTSASPLKTNLRGRVEHFVGSPLILWVPP